MDHSTEMPAVSEAWIYDDTGFMTSNVFQKVNSDREYYLLPCQTRRGNDSYWRFGNQWRVNDFEQAQDSGWKNDDLFL